MPTDDTWSDDDVQEWLERGNRELRPMIQRSDYSISLMLGSEPDAKQAVELGFILLLGKPLILAVAPGVEVPAGLVRAADAIVEADLRNSKRTHARVHEAIARLEADDDD